MSSCRINLVGSGKLLLAAELAALVTICGAGGVLGVAATLSCATA
ncbi:Uncharacterised protein [Mycobacterium tuberculosis]|uniref:Uncharacterized protein n=1 Tax=Mycobacterium tuberculosis TaxID=1773 RepID=A0A0T7LIA1_MYCTX|nr:Uncharacterised protein [Mycobacterium tuberculosis]CFR95180.1 Uncharacterised protein [Mycobacterium tuberculosis]CNV94390.1 Uncharacterised protein [Mycobacterium tuberculosis]COX55686.1 Uncharacterised protein [Mycobacterium tuberculosis]